MTTQHPFDPAEWMRRRQARAFLTPAEWMSARLALLDQLDALADDVPVIVHPYRDLFTTPDPKTPWLHLVEREALARPQFTMAYHRKDARGEPQWNADQVLMRWRDGELFPLRPVQIGEGWRAAVIFAAIADPKEMRGAE